MNGYTFRGSNSAIFTHLFYGGSTLKGKNLLPFFSLRVDPTGKDVSSMKANMKSHRLFPFVGMAEQMEMHPVIKMFNKIC